MKTFQIILLLLLCSLSILGQTINPPDQKLTRTEIEDLTVSELWVLRNAIFARYGRPFKTYELHALFMKQKWYKPSDAYKPSDLSEMDLYNVNLLYNRESELRQNDYREVGQNKGIKFENVYNTYQYPEFNEEEKDMLSTNGFIVYPTNWGQLFHIYENNDYLGIPSFISVDAVLQLYHLYFDMTLRNIETDYLSSKLKILLDQTINELVKLRNNTSNPNIISAIDLNLVYLGVSHYFIEDGKVQLKGGLSNLASKEIENCKNQSGFQASGLLNREFDYSLFIPRGHYTRSEELKRFFLSMMWLGNAGLDLTKEKNILSSVILTHVLYETTWNGIPLISIWEDIYEPTVFYVGMSDDTGPVELKEAMDKVFQNITGISQFDNSSKLSSLPGNLPSQRISGHGTWGKQNQQFRLMGQRFIPDSYIFDRLTGRSRIMPNSLDIMAGFGNKKAYELMMNEYSSSWEAFPDYPDELDKIIKENKEKSEEEWTQNLYYYWLYNLKSLYEIKNHSELPFFMTTDAYELKTLSTALASWSEL